MIQSSIDLQLQGNRSLKNWILSVDKFGKVSILDHPPIHASFLDEGLVPEYLGMATEVKDAAGVYEAKCVYHEANKWNSEYEEDWRFDIEEMIPIYIIPQEKMDYGNE